MPADTEVEINETITMQEMTKSSGLSEHAIRYYEKIGLLHSIKRDGSSGHRQFHQDDVYRVITLACLRATGMSINEMRRYFKLNESGLDVSEEQIALFEKHKAILKERIEKMRHRLTYLDGKVEYWKAKSAGEMAKAKRIGLDNFELAKQLNKE